MKRSKIFLVAVARTSLLAMTAFTLVVAVRVLGTDLPPGHPPVESCPQFQLPPGHPPVDAERIDRLPPGHPPVEVERLPVGHPPIDGLRPTLPVFPQDGTSTI
jgi:hypothetical protein